jgi:hypothetical protein
LKRGTPDNPKVAHLAQLLNIELWGAVGILEILWHFTAKYCPCGDIGRFTDKQIAKAVGWQRPTGARGVTPECRLSDALVTAKWLDRCTCHRLVVHDWKDHADQAVTKFLDRHGISFVHTVAILPLPLPLPLPHPAPSPPDKSSLSGDLKEGAVSSASPPGGLVAAQPSEVSTEVQDAGKEAVVNTSAPVETPTQSKRKLPGQTKLEYEIWQRQQEQKGRIQ